MGATIPRYRIPANSPHWIARRRIVFEQWAEWGLDWKSISLYGLSREEGYREFVPIGEIVNPDTARIENGKFYRLRRWKSKEHWEWMRQNCPMVLINDFEFEEETE